jgi:hypothetical protein
MPARPNRPRARPDASREARSLLLPVRRFVQPDETSCGPTCLAKVLEFHGERGVLADLLRSVRRLDHGGTLAVFLGLAALARGYHATVWSYNTRLLDPTWFDLPPEALRAKCLARAAWTRDRKLRTALRGYASFLEAGGTVRWEELTPPLLVRMLDRGHPIVTGLNATYLYREVRESSVDGKDDDVRGQPVGHFVVICGYRRDGAAFAVRDPSAHAPYGRDGRYHVPAARLVNSILLGDATYDDVLLEIRPHRRRRPA